MTPRMLSLISISLLLMKYAIVSSASDPKTNTTDDQFLLAFKSQITLDPRNILSNNWSTSSSFCNWVGVACNLRRQRVASLNLANFQLEGTIAPQLGSLSFLVSINLSNNNFHGQIPREVANLHRLKYLNLGYNKFSGRIPIEIGNLDKLQTVHLNGNNLTGNIPREIGNCTWLQEIYMDTNNLTGIIPKEMANLHNLQVLDLSSNNITGSISPALFNLSMLRSVNLGYNFLSGQLPSSTGRWLPNLELLNLENNGLNGPIPNSIGNASRLSVLDISYNLFSGYIPDELGNLVSLKRLNLAENNLTGKPSSAELSFLSSLSNCRQLTLLRFNGNPLRGRLPSSIRNMSTTLQELYGYDCNIEGNVPGEIGNLTNLIGLILQNNELTGTIPREIGRLRRLQDFSLASNKLHGQIPLEMCDMERLSYLFLLENRFSGSLPECLSNVTSLRELYMSYNRFETIPSSFWTLKYLLQINFSFNALSGSLPVQIENLKVLTKIDFSSNQLSGDIPTTIGYLQNLAYLSLSNNRFQGPIPQSFGELIGAETLDLSGNYLSGSIPKSLEKLIHLKHFNVSSNRLQGEIPNEGPFANFSFLSFIDNAGLCGPSRMQFPLCKSSNNKQSKKTGMLLVLYIVPPIASLLLLLAISLVFLRCRKRNLKIPNEEEFLRPQTWRRVSYHELENATDGFSEINLLGTGSFGSVYKGTLPDGTYIAVKVFNSQLEGAFARFDAECDMLRNLRHRNLVKVISSCCSPYFMALILEFMPFWSLEKWLYSHNYFLDILQRLNVMVDVASALEHLHHGHVTPVVHCDLKPSNVLIDEDMTARVADFGISKLLGEGDSMTQTMTLATIGYMAPEYGSQGLVSVRGDVYSFGILLMETFTRKKPTDEMFSGEMSLKHWIKQSLPDAVTEVADANLLRKEEEHFAAKKYCIISVLNLSLQCSSDFPEDRMCMKEALAALKKIVAVFKREIALISKQE